MSSLTQVAAKVMNSADKKFPGWQMSEDISSDCITVTYTQPPNSVPAGIDLSREPTTNRVVYLTFRSSDIQVRVNIDVVDPESRRSHEKTYTAKLKSLDADTGKFLIREADNFINANK